MFKVEAKINNKVYSVADSKLISVKTYVGKKSTECYSRELLQNSNGDYFFLNYGGPDSPCAFINNKGKKTWGAIIEPANEEEAEEFIKEEGLVYLMNDNI